MSKLFCIEILEEKPVISFDELLYIRSQIANSVISNNENSEESS
jgi:hypothetical protein